MAFWWQVVLYMLAKYTDKSGDDVVEIVYQEWPFSMKHIFHPKELANIMRMTGDQTGMESKSFCDVLIACTFGRLRFSVAGLNQFHYPYFATINDQYKFKQILTC